jgi:hypothetical protein
MRPFAIVVVTMALLAGCAGGGPVPEPPAERVTPAAAPSPPAGVLRGDRFDGAAATSVAETMPAAADAGHQHAAGKSPSAVYACPMHPEVTSDHPGKCPKCGMDLVKREPPAVLYACPMHPEVTSDHPGKCPKCGMDLVMKKD